jgi:hypothetical protein
MEAPQGSSSSSSTPADHDAILGAASTEDITRIMPSKPILPRRNKANNADQASGPEDGLYDELQSSALSAEAMNLNRFAISEDKNKTFSSRRIRILRILTWLLLCALMGGLGYAVYTLSRSSEDDKFSETYTTAVDQLFGELPVSICMRMYRSIFFRF